MALVKCPNCGSSVSDSAKICVKCNSVLNNDNLAVTHSSMVNNEKSIILLKTKKTMCMIVCLLGLFLAILGIVIFAEALGKKYNSKYVYDTSFGGDFYTYEYRATKAAADNVSGVGELLWMCFRVSGIVMIIIGLSVSVMAYIKKIDAELELSRLNHHNNL